MSAVALEEKWLVVGWDSAKVRAGVLGVQGLFILATLMLLATLAPAQHEPVPETIVRAAAASLVYVLAFYCGDLFDRKPWTLLPTRISVFRWIVRVGALAVPALLATAWLDAPYTLVALHMVAVVAVARAAQPAARHLSDRLNLAVREEAPAEVAETADPPRTRAIVRSLGRAAKRGVDVGAGVALALLLLPITPVIALAIRLQDGGPILYSQIRVGRSGRHFRIRKFRTMRPDAEAATGPVWSTPDDPRITRIGRWLRVTRLDELPQAWNLIVGEMSLVGPRPERPELESSLREAIPSYDGRHAVRPGLTGWAQVNLPLSASVEIARRKIDFDLYYARHASLAFDAYILARSARILLGECERFLVGGPHHQ